MRKEQAPLLKVSSSLCDEGQASLGVTRLAWWPGGVGAKTCIAPESATGKPDSEGLVTVNVMGPRGRRPGAQAAPPLPGPRARSPLESLSDGLRLGLHPHAPPETRQSQLGLVTRVTASAGLAKLSRPGLSESRPGL